VNSLLRIVALALLIAAAASAVAAEEISSPAPAPDVLPAGTAEGWYARIDTSLGSIVGRLLPQQAPQSVAHFAAFAEGRMTWTDIMTGEKKTGPFYDGLTIHKAVPAERFERPARGAKPAGAPARSSAAAGVADATEATEIPDFPEIYRAAGVVEPAHGFTAERVELLHLGERKVSSSSIREALVEGDLTWPQEALGRRFVLDGMVVRGAGRGTGIGWPTANLQTLPRLLLPGSGVYAGRVKVPAGGFVSAINVGTNPTFGVEPLHVESFLLDFEGYLVGEPMAIEFWARLRDELRFETAEALSDAIADDVRRTRELVPPA